MEGFPKMMLPLVRSGRQRPSGALLFTLSLALVGCIPKVKPGEATATQASPEAKVCPEGVIDDGEDGNNQVNATRGRGGYWYTFVDKAGSTVSPTAGEQNGTFAMAQSGANASVFAARMTGKIGTGSVVFSGMGINFTDPKGPYDAAAYTAISFWAKRGEGTGRVRVKVPDVSTDPAGQICTECFNDFGADLELTTAWTKYVLPFSQMRQLPGWGSPHPPAIDPSKLYGVQFQVNVPTAAYDIWVDDLQFTGCR